MFYEAGPAAGFLGWFAQAHPRLVHAAVAAAPQRYPIIDAERVFPNGQAVNPFAQDCGAISLHRFVDTPLLFLAPQNAPPAAREVRNAFEHALHNADRIATQPIRIEIEVLGPDENIPSAYLARARKHLFGVRE